MELRKQGIVFHRRGRYALTEPGQCFRGMAHAGFILRREKERPEKRAMDAVAKRQLGILQFLQKFPREIGRLLQQWPQKSIPGFNRVRPVV